MTKNGQKLPRQGFWTFSENHVISFVCNLCKMKVPYVFLFCGNYIFGKNLVLKLQPKMALGQ